MRDALARLYGATRDARWADLVRECAGTLERHAVPDHGGLNWPAVERDGPPLKCQWCVGAPGIGLFWTRAYEVLGDPAYLQMATAAGECTYGYGDVRANPSQCHGLSGNAELFIELHRVTRDGLWLERAHDFARQIMRYCSPGRTGSDEGDVWRGDEPGNTSPDYAYGAAGPGHFFLRLLSPDRVRWALD